MKIPNKVKIGGVIYTVLLEQRIMNSEHFALCGQIDYDMATIKIEPDVQDQQGKCRTFLHEIFHGIERHFKMDLTEEEIDNLANGLYMVIQDNPEIFNNAE